MLIEFGDHEHPLAINLYVSRLIEAIEHLAVPGIVEVVPGLRSALLTFDRRLRGTDGLIALVEQLAEGISRWSDITIEGRQISLPIAFDDDSTLSAVTLHRDADRAFDHDTPDNEDAQEVCAANGLTDPEELYELILESEWWTAFIGFTPGLPFLYAVQDRYAVRAPKHERVRQWTAEGAVGVGGRALAIYPVEGPGYFQLLGRTLPIFDSEERNHAFRHDATLLQAGDLVRFYRVSEQELLHLRRKALEDRFRYSIEPVRLAARDLLAGSHGDRPWTEHG